MKPAAFIAVAYALSLGVSCAPDPVLHGIVDDQGNETKGIPQNQYHRAGQRCGACHTEGGTASDSPFVISGTVFAQPNREVGVGGALVELTDSSATESKIIVTTNCVGNFFVKPGNQIDQGQWNPQFPIAVRISKNGLSRSMRGLVNREISCAGCHSIDMPPKDPLSETGHVYLFNSDEQGALKDGDSACDAPPIRPGSE
jgi:hypothetical protein